MTTVKNPVVVTTPLSETLAQITGHLRKHTDEEAARVLAAAAVFLGVDVAVVQQLKAVR